MTVVHDLAIIHDNPIQEFDTQFCPPSSLFSFHLRTNVQNVCPSPDSPPFLQSWPLCSLFCPWHSRQKGYILPSPCSPYHPWTTRIDYPLFLSCREQEITSILCHMHKWAPYRLSLIAVLASFAWPLSTVAHCSVCVKWPENLSFLFGEMCGPSPLLGSPPGTCFSMTVVCSCKTGSCYSPTDWTGQDVITSQQKHGETRLTGPKTAGGHSSGCFSVATAETRATTEEASEKERIVVLLWLSGEIHVTRTREIRLHVSWTEERIPG